MSTQNVDALKDTLCRVCGQERDASEIVKIDAKDGEVGFQLWCPKREGIYDHQFAPPLKHLDIPQRSAQETHDLQQVGAAVVDDALRSTEATLVERTASDVLTDLRSFLRDNGCPEGCNETGCGVTFVSLYRFIKEQEAKANA